MSASTGVLLLLLAAVILWWDFERWAETHDEHGRPLDSPRRAPSTVTTRRGDTTPRRHR